MTTLTTLFSFTDYSYYAVFFTIIKMKYLTTLTTLFFFTDHTNYAVFFHWLNSIRCFTSLLLKWIIWLRSLRCFSSLTALTTRFYFTIIKMKYLPTITTLFFCIDYTHFTIFLHWLHSVHCFTSLLIKWLIWLRSLCCFSSLTTLTTLFYFTSIKKKYLTMLPTLFFFTDCTNFAILLHWLHSVNCFTSLLL